MSTTTVKSFLDQLIGFMSGDEDKVVAAKITRQRESALKVHLSKAEGDLINKEDDVTNAEEALVAARFNKGELIKDRDQYVSKLVERSERVKDTQEDLEAHKGLITFLKAELAI